MLTSALLPCRFIVPAISLFCSSLFAAPQGARPGGTKVAEISPDLVKAAKIAESNANRRPTRHCWRYVKQALVAAKVVDSYPDGVSAKYAGSVLTHDYGFVKLDGIEKPEDAPVGAVLVYGGAGHGHIEFRTEKGYVSDFKTANHSQRPLTGVYAKFEQQDHASDDHSLAKLETEWDSLRERWSRQFPVNGVIH